MPVFISHRFTDLSKAKSIHARLTRIHGITCWLDSVNAYSDPSTITAQILKGINDCTHLLALVTTNTSGSWWVPYEIGVAQQGQRAITSFSQLPRVSLPEYLWHWPVLSSDHGIDQFAAVYKLERLSLEHLQNFSKGASAINSGYVNATRPGTASGFHQKLKQRLQQ